MFETYYNNLMAMKKMDIIKEGITWGFFANYESTINSLNGQTGNSGILIPEIFFEKTLDKSNSQCYTIITERGKPPTEKENEL